MEMVVDGETREITDLIPTEINLEANAIRKAAGAVEVGTLPQPSSTVPTRSAGRAAAKTGYGEGTMFWT